MSRKFIALATIASACAGAAFWATQADGAATLGKMLQLAGMGDSPMPLPVKNDAKPAPRTVRVVMPEAVAGTASLSLAGRTAPAEEALLSSRASGIVSERRVDIGDQVKAGDILIVIEAPEVEQELRRARAAADQVRARLLLADATLQRGESLVDKGHVSVQTVDERRATKKTAEADLAAALAEVKRLEEVQSFQTVRAPFDGTIIARHIERGDKVSGDASQAGGYLLRIARLDELRVLIDVPQSSALTVKPGAPAKVAFAELPAPLSAKIVRVSGLIDQTSSTMRAELLMPNPAGRIPAGMNGQVTIEVAQDRSLVTVPTNTLITRSGRQMVGVVDPQNRFQLRPIGVERDLGDRVVIATGLTVGDRVIVSPNALLRPNDEVEVVAPTVKAAAAKP
ncbi:MAG: efflux RND transporter periplasmic adaptor subunit [Hyphomicrobium sp.]|jgi:multidrug efflux system membrane fusion protein